MISSKQLETQLQAKKAQALANWNQINNNAPVKVYSEAWYMQNRPDGSINT